MRNAGRAGTAAVIAAAALVAVPVVAAEVTDRISVRGTGGNHVDGYSPTLKVVAVSPDEYRRGCCYDANGGQWIGPTFTGPGVGSDDSDIDWGVHIHSTIRSVRPAITAGLAQDWPVAEQGQKPVEHVVGGKVAGTIAATWVLTRPSLNERFGKSAQWESAIGFSICGPVAVTNFQALNPGSAEYRVKGSIAAETWNREQVFAAVRSVRLEGNLPVARVRAAARGKTVRGTVTDCHGHAVSAVRVTLEQQAGSRWKIVRSGRTATNGSVSLGARSAGVYRISAASKRSAAVRVR
jgi:hypothetical protein